jgi:Methylamine utilisation protein MauE
MLAACILAFCRVAIALLFALAFAGKIRNIRAFQEAVVDFRLLPANWSKKLAVVFLTGEFLACACVVSGGFLLLAGFLLATGLLMLFSAGLLTVIQRRMKITCNCFGWTDRRVSGYDIVRNAVLILCSLSGAWTSITASQNLTMGEFGLIALIAVYFVVLMTNLANIVETLRRPFYAFLDQ